MCCWYENARTNAIYIILSVTHGNTCTHTHIYFREINFSEELKLNSFASSCVILGASLPNFVIWFHSVAIFRRCFADKPKKVKFTYSQWQTLRTWSQYCKWILSMHKIRFDTALNIHFSNSAPKKFSGQSSRSTKVHLKRWKFADVNIWRYVAITTITPIFYLSRRYDKYIHYIHWISEAP